MQLASIVVFTVSDNHVHNLLKPNHSLTQVDEFYIGTWPGVLSDNERPGLEASFLSVVLSFRLYI